jgi:hypothetical protein
MSEYQKYLESLDDILLEEKIRRLQKERDKYERVVSDVKSEISAALEVQRRRGASKEQSEP